MTGARLELTRVPMVQRLLTSRWMPWLLIALTLPVFLLVVLTGLFGTPAGSRNFGIIFVWIVWWALLQGKVLRGGMGTGMPEWGSLYSDQELWAVVAFLRSFTFDTRTNR